jgi:hypothetical protein
MKHGKFMTYREIRWYNEIMECRIENEKRHKHNLFLSECFPFCMNEDIRG